MKSIIAFIFLLSVGLSASSRGFEQPKGNKFNYYFSRFISHKTQKLYREVFDFISDVTCVNFHYDKHRTAKNSVKIKLAHPECSPRIGLTENDNVILDCDSFEVAFRHVMYALGISHRHEILPTDMYLIDNSTNSNDNQDHLLVPFDYGSAMLYPRKEEYLLKDQEYNYTVGSERMSFYDIILLNVFYNCNCDEYPVLECQNGGYQIPGSCDKCLCPDGFQGQLCENARGKFFEASTEWKFEETYFETNTSSITEKVERYGIITAPPNSTIEVQLTGLDGFDCHETCNFNGVELKFKEDRRITNPVVCCEGDNLWNKIRSSKNNPLVVLLYGEHSGPKVTWRYRYVPDQVQCSAVGSPIF